MPRPAVTRPQIAVLAHDLDVGGRQAALARNTWRFLEQAAAQKPADLGLDLLFTGPRQQLAARRGQLQSLGIAAHTLDGLPPAKDSSAFSVEPFLARSEAIWRRIAEQPYRAWVFQDRRGEGFYPVRARRMGLALQSTPLFVIAAGPTSWLWARDKKWSDNPFRDMRLSFMERYCHQFADAVVLPDAAIVEWMASQRWPAPAGAIAPDRQGLERIFAPGAGARSAPPGEPLVSICIAHFNHGRFFPQTLAALAASDYANFEVLAVDDASTDGESLAVFQRLQSEYAGRGWRFFSRPVNEGNQRARNFAAQHARGELLIFVDSDNRPHPGMIGDFVRAMRCSGADSLSCWFYLKSDAQMLSTAPSARMVKPLGAALEFGWVTNVFGDANFCVKRDVFAKLDGFRAGKIAEDWDFLLRLAAAGFDHDVLPRPVFDYRETPQSMSRKMDYDAILRALLESYTEGVPPAFRRLLFEFAVPSQMQMSQLEHRLTALAASMWKR